jgi:hypothetical protein
VPVELVDIAAARLVLLVCIDTCKVFVVLFRAFLLLVLLWLSGSAGQKQMFRTVLA